MSNVYEDNPKVEVFGGYQYLHIGGGFNGWNVSVAGNITPHFGIEGNFW